MALLSALAAVVLFVLGLILHLAHSKANLVTDFELAGLVCVALWALLVTLGFVGFPIRRQPPQ